MTVEAAKPPSERGHCVNPELFGAPPEKSIAWARNPRLMKRVKNIQEKQAAETKKAGKPPRN